MKYADASSNMLLRAVPALLLRNIVVPTDFSPASEIALAYARAIAGRNSSQLTLLHAIPPSGPTGAKASTPAEYLADIEQKLCQEAATCSGLNCHTRVVKGTTIEA